VNIIGEHTDYNEGFVLPAAIDKAIYVSVGKRNDDLIKLYSEEFSESFNVHISDIKPTGNWSTYILGVVNELGVRGHELGGFNLVVDGDIPIGAGLSSSAAVECAVVFALNELFELGIERLEMVKIAQKAEHTFSGVMCGIMDMFASIMGKKDHVIRLDCRSLEYEYEPFLLDGYKILLLNTNVKHSLASSAYNTRRQECEQGVSWVKEHHPHVNSLRDVTMQMLNEHVLPKGKIVHQRCSFVIQEIDRLLKACIDLENGDIHSMGKKMFQTHDGLSKLYEVSCAEADFLVDAVRNNPVVVGARMMGGGFGGCTINIIRENAIDELVEDLSAKYSASMGKKLSSYVSVIEDGTKVVMGKWELGVGN
jgi:galactokinase